MIDVVDLAFLNELKQEDRQKRKMQNKRYREKHREIIILKKQLAYCKQKYESRLENSIKV